MLPYSVAVLFILIGAAMLFLYRRTYRLTDDVVHRGLQMQVKWIGLLSVVCGVVMLVLLANRAI